MERKKEGGVGHHHLAFSRTLDLAILSQISVISRLRVSASIVVSLVTSIESKKESCIAKTAQKLQTWTLENGRVIRGSAISRER